MEYLCYYAIGILIWFVMSIFKSGILLQDKNTWSSIKEAMLWPVELIYLFGTFVNVFSIVTYKTSVILRTKFKEYNIKRNVETPTRCQDK